VSRNRLTEVLLIAAFALVTADAARADYLQASNAYAQKDFATAFRELKPLAELGHAPSQYMLAIMYLRGEGSTLNSTLGYGWMKLAADAGYEPARRDLPRVQAQMAEESVEAASRLLKDFETGALEERLLPHYLSSRDYQAISTPTVLRASAPPYTSLALNRSVTGTVIAELTVAPDGTVRDTRIVRAFPPDVDFDVSVLSAAPTWTFTPATKDGVPTRAIVPVAIDFQQPNIGSARNPFLRNLKQIETSAQEGDAESQYVLALYNAGSPRLHKPWSEVLPWITRAAQAGLKEAQYQLGESLLLGRGCEADERKATLWLQMAAQQEEPNAQVALAKIALSSGSADTSRAMAWLTRAAAADPRRAARYLASVLAASPKEALRDPAKALEVLQGVKPRFDGDPGEPATLEIRAAALANSDKFDEAVQAQKDAIRMAASLKWDTASMQQRLSSYEQRQRWFGELLF
jgi:TonB family protein